MSEDVLGLERARLRSGPLRLRAHWLAIDPETREVEAADVRVTACPCADPPWRLDARGARLSQNGDLTLTSTTVRVGGAPVLWLPALLVRTGREPALLTPELGFRGDDGVIAGTGAYLPVGPADVEVRARVASEGRLETRTAAALGDGHADVTTFRGDVRVRADGHADRLAFEVDRATDPAIVDRLATTLPDAARDPLHSAAYVSLPMGDAVAVSSGATLHGDAGPAPRIVLSAGGPLGWRRLLGRSALVADRDAATETQRADGSTAIELRAPAGPLRLGAEVGGRATAWRGLEDAARLVGGGGADVRLPLERSFGAWRHEIAPSLAFRTIALERANGEAPGVDDRDRVSPRRRVDARIDTTLEDRGALAATAALVASVSERPFGQANVALGPVSGAAAWDPQARHATLLEAGATVSPGSMEVAAGWRRIRPGASLVTVEDVDAFTGADPFALARPAEEAWAGVGVRWPLGLRTGAEARYDLVAEAPSWVAGRLGWSARCRCLSVDGVVSRRAGRETPDAFVSVALQ